MLLSVTALLGLVVVAPQAPAVEQQIDQLAGYLIDEVGVVGLVIGTVAEGESEVRGYGRVAKDGDAVPDGRTVYEIGSITKTFTGILLARAVEEGEVDLAAQAREYLPEEAVLPTWEDEQVQLVHLATHTSGFPRMPVDIQPVDPRNPYADYDVSHLHASLARTLLAERPGAVYAYSNLGVGLLGHILERASGDEFERLVRARITAPLGMSDTAVVLGEDLRPRLAPGYRPGGRPQKNWDFDVLAAAGALRSTADDMLIYARANLRPDATSIATSLRDSHALHHRFAGGGGVGLGWHWTNDGRILWHNGETAGYKCILLLHPRDELAVVVLANTPSDRIDSLGHRVLALLRGEEVAGFARETIELDPAIIERYVGEYRFNIKVSTRITRDDLGLKAQVAGQGSRRLHPRSETRFFLREVDAEVEFLIADDGSVSALVLHRGGVEQRAERVP